MNTAQKVLVGLVSTLLFITITVGVPLAAIGSVVSNKEQVKQVLLSEAVYSAVKDAFATDPTTSLSVEETAIEPVTVDQEAIGQIVDQFLTQEVYSQNITRLVDGFYAYLDGEASEVNVDIVITNQPEQFKAFVENTFISTYNQLPECGAGFDSTSYDPLNADCSVPSVSDAQIRQLIESEPDYAQLLNGSLTITSAETPAGQETSQFGNLDPQSLRSIRNSYQFLQSMKLVFVISSVILVGLLAAIVHSKQLFKVVGLALFVPTVFLLISGLLGWLGQRSLINSVTPAGEQTVRNTFIAETLGNFIRHVNNTVFLYASVLLLISLACIITWVLLSRGGGTSPTVQKVNS